MLSVYPISTPQGMSTYYDSDGYYAKGDEQAQLASQWHGKGAASAGYSGPIKPEDFQSVLDGNTPDGRRLGRTVDGQRKHRAGIDLTFSAPKSVSIMALVAGDNRLIEAHNDAVKATLNHIEEKVLETRVWDSAAKAQFKERNLEMIAGMFRHEVNRNQDPHLHTHAVVANMTRPADGKWRSIEGASLLHHKMELGAMYRAELAMNIRELGYEIERTHMDGRFDIKGVSKSIMAAFSTRSAEIREALAGYDYQNAKTAANATLMTRDHKVTVDRDILHKDWTKKGERLGLKTRIPDQPVFADKAEETRLAGEAVDYAIRHLSERASVFNLSDLRTTANGYGVGQFRPQTLDQAIASDKRLIASRHRDHVGREYVTTLDAIRCERETIATMREAQKTSLPFMETSEINKGLKDTFLNQGQQNAVRAILNSHDRIMGIQGYAGVGKTTLLAAARELAEKKGYEVMGLAPSASAAKTLQAEAGIESRTLQKFLGQYDGYAHGRGSEAGKKAVQEEFKNKMIVVDESSLASTNQIRDLLRIVKTIKPDLKTSTRTSSRPTSRKKMNPASLNPVQWIRHWLKPHSRHGTPCQKTSVMTQALPPLLTLFAKASTLWCVNNWKKKAGSSARKKRSRHLSQLDTPRQKKAAPKTTSRAIRSYSTAKETA